MRARGTQFVASVVGVAIFAAAMVYPITWLVVRSLIDDPGAAESTNATKAMGLTFLPWRLLGTSCLLAMAAAGLAVLLALPGAYLLGRLDRPFRAGWVLGAMFVPMLFPAMVYAFGWQRLVHVPDCLRCVWVWASWSWPLPALLIGTGWSRSGRRLYEEALTTTDGTRAFLRVVLPALSREVIVSMLVLFALFLGEYTVPHACNMQVYATALLSCAESCASPLNTLWPSLPIVGVIVVAAATAVCVWRRFPVSGESAGQVSERTPAWGLRLIVLVLAFGCVAVPVARLAKGVEVFSAMRLAAETYGRELLDSFLVVLASGAVVLVMGVCLACSSRWIRRTAVVWSVLLAAVPGAVVGEALVVGYNPWPVVYDHWPLVVLGYVARFGWIGMLVVWLTRAGTGPEQASAARIDGAGEWTVTWQISLLPNWAMLLAGVFVVAALSLSEVAISCLVRVPRIGNVAMILIDKFHVQEDAMLVSLSLWLVGAAIPGAVLAAVSARRWR